MAVGVPAARWLVCLTAGVLARWWHDCGTLGGTVGGPLGVTIDGARLGALVGARVGTLATR